MKKGFTLLEIVLALAIFGVAITAITGFQARGYMNNARARNLTTAVELARYKMTEFQLALEKEIAKGAFPEDTSEEGNFDKPHEDYHWNAELRKVELPVPPLGEGEQQDVTQQMMQVFTKQIGDLVREVRVTIGWEEFGKEREFSVVTHMVKM